MTSDNLGDLLEALGSIELSAPVRFGYWAGMACLAAITSMQWWPVGDTVAQLCVVLGIVGALLRWEAR